MQILLGLRFRTDICGFSVANRSTFPSNLTLQNSSPRSTRSDDIRHFTLTSCINSYSKSTLTHSFPQLHYGTLAMCLPRQGAPKRHRDVHDGSSQFGGACNRVGRCHSADERCIVGPLYELCALSSNKSTPGTLVSLLAGLGYISHTSPCTASTWYIAGKKLHSQCVSKRVKLPKGVKVYVCVELKGVLSNE